MTKRINKTNARDVAATTNAPSSITLAQRAEVAMKAAFIASEFGDKMKDNKEGAYTVAACMFETGATEAELRAAFEAAEAKARSGELEGVTLHTGKRKGKDGAPVYLIPGSFMNAKSTVTSAARLKIRLDGSVTYGAIYKAVKEAKALESAAAANDQQKAYAALLLILEQITDTIKENKDSDRETLVAMTATLQTAMDTLAEVAEGAETVSVTVSGDVAEALAEAA